MMSSLLGGNSDREMVSFTGGMISKCLGAEP